MAIPARVRPFLLCCPSILRLKSLVGIWRTMAPDRTPCSDVSMSRSVVSVATCDSLLLSVQVHDAKYLAWFKRCEDLLDKGLPFVAAGYNHQVRLETKLSDIFWVLRWDISVSDGEDLRAS